MATIGKPLPTTAGPVLGGSAPTPIQKASSAAVLNNASSGSLGVLEKYTPANQLNTFQSNLAPVAPTPAPTTTPAKTVAPTPSKPVTAKATPAPVNQPIAVNQLSTTATPSQEPVEMVDIYDKTGNKTSVSKKDFETNPFYKNEGYSTTDQSAANKEAKEKETSTKINSLLQQGYDNPTNLATAAGMTVDEINDFLNTNENASYMLSINQNNNKLDQAYKDYKAQMDSITNGTFALTPSEQADVKSIQDSFDRLRQQQITANQNYEGAVQTGEIRSGRQEFMNQISSGIYKQALDNGVSKIADIESQAASSVRAYKDAVQAKNYKAADAAYGAISKYLSDKSDAIKELHNVTVEEYKRQQDLIKSANDSITASLNQKKLQQDIAKSTIEGLTPALAGANDEIIQDLASYYGIDANILTGSVIGEAQKFEKDMIGKGYRTINPADADKMRSIGAEVITYNGRAYMKEPELKSITNKGNVDFFKGTKKVGSSSLTGGGPGVGASTGFNKKITTEKLNTFLSSVIGADLKVSPDDYKRAKSAWITDGGLPADFDTEFKGYQDPYNEYN